jgi:hypothetical protein
MNITAIKKTTFFIIILGVLAFSSLSINATLIYIMSKNAKTYSQSAPNKKIAEFRDMFERDVLLSGKEVDFNTRLTLETAVRALNDTQILKSWERFTNAQTKEVATAEARNLLEILIEKTSL